MDEIRVLLVDDNAEMRRSLHEQLSKQEGLRVTGECANGLEALEALGKGDVDVMVLDIIMPQMDGYALMEEMRRQQLPHMPRIIVTTALGRDDFVMRAVELGATFFLAKPFDAQSVRNRVRDCVALKEGRHIEPRSRTVVRMGEKSVDERISTMFITMGIPAHIKGYTFLREAVKMVIGNPDIINRITKELYPGIARTYDTSASKVERAIRHAIEVAWTRGKIENINDIFGYNVYTRNDKPTNGEFIALIADKLMLENAA